MGDKFIVPPGTKITIEIDEETGDVSEQVSSPEGGGGGELPGLLPGYFDDELLFRRPDTPVIIFLDLGTRLRSMAGVPPAEDLTRARELTDTTAPAPVAGGFNEYVEINASGETFNFASLQNVNPANSGTKGFQAEIMAGLYLDLDKACLGSRAPGAADTLDPLGTTPANGSARKLANCMPLSFKLWDGDRAGSVPVDLILRQPAGEGEEGRTETLPLSEADRPAVRLIGDPYNGGEPIPNLDASRWKQRQPKPEKDGQEVWNTANIAEGVAFGTGYLDTAGMGGRWDVEIDSRLYYERFNTADKVSFKVTSEARFDAAEVEFKLAGGSPARIFLKPQWVVMCPARTWTTQIYVVHYKTYYFHYNAHDNPPNSTVGVLIVQTAQTPAENGLYIVSNVHSVFNPALRAGLYVIEGSFADCQGVLNGAVIPGTPLNRFPGDIGCLVSGDVEIAPGLFAHGGDVFLNLNPDDNDHFTATATAETKYIETAETFGVAYFLTTASVGRVPIYGRLFRSSWATVYDYMGQSPAYQASKGIQLGFNSGNGGYMGGELAFKRRPLWNAKEVAKEGTGEQKFRPLSYYAQDEAHGRECSVGGSPTDAPALVARPLGEVAAYLTEGRARADALAACLGGMGWHKDITVEYAAGGFYAAGGNYDRSLDIIPSRSVPAGRLCGIIEQAGRVFYVWGRTAIDNYLPDFEREQASGII